MSARHEGNGSRRPVQIMKEINQTRAEMDDTLSAIEYRLTPGQLLDQGLDYLKSSGAREYAANLGSSVKTNPMPATLAGIGIAWMMAVGSRSPAPQDDGSGVGIGESMRSTGESVGQGLQSARDSVGERVQSAKQTLMGGMQSAKEHASQLRGSARATVDSARESWDYVLREHPLVLGAIGLALGAVVAAAAPRTRKEDELMGEARDDLMERAKQAGGEKLDPVTSAAKDAVARDVEASGLTPKGDGKPHEGTPKESPAKREAWPYPTSSGG